MAAKIFRPFLPIWRTNFSIKLWSEIKLVGKPAQKTLNHFPHLRGMFLIQSYFLDNFDEKGVARVGKVNWNLGTNATTIY